jgi:hypothetical protein
VGLAWFGGPIGAGAEVTSPEPRTGPRVRSRTALWAWMGAVAALVLVPVGLMTLRGADPSEPSAIEAPTAESTSAEMPLSEPGPVESGSAESMASGDTSATDPDPPEEPQVAPSPVVPAVPATTPPECARLLERASLGEVLTQEEAAFLARRCRH